MATQARSRLPVAGKSPRGSGDGPIQHRTGWPVIALAALPIVVAAARAVADGWLPLGDNAYFTVRSRDVLTSSHPLLGAWSSGSAQASTPVNNLGPLQLDLLAPFTKVGPAAGTAVGVAVVNLAAVVGIGLVLRRRASVPASMVGLAVTAVVAWTMGSELLIEPRQHHALMLAFLCFLFLAWAVADGDRWVLPWLAAVASLLLQTHLSYAIVVTLLAAASTVALVVRTRSGGADGPVRWRARLRLPAVVTAVVLAVLWAQTAIDQVAGTGNLGRLRRAGSDGGTAPGVRLAVRIVGGVLAWPASWFRSGFRDVTPGAGSPTLTAAAAALLVLVALLVITAVVAVRRRDRAAATAAGVALAGALVAVVAVARTPAGGLGPVVGNYRWLWPLAGFAVFAVVTVAVGASRSGADSAISRPATGAAGVVLVVATVANLSTAYQVPVSRYDRPRRPVAADIQGQLRSAELDGPVLFERPDGPFGEPYTYAVLAQLQDQGVEFVFPADSNDVNRFGETRRDDGSARTVLTLVIGSGARDMRAGSERIAFASSLSRADLARSEALARQAVVDLSTEDLVPTASGRRAIQAGEYPAVASVVDGGADDAVYVASELQRMVGRDHLSGSDRAMADVEEMASLLGRPSETVAVYLRPRG